MTMTDDRITYTYERFTPRGRLHLLTDPEHMELAQRILGDQVFCEQVAAGVLRKLHSDNPNTVYEGLGSIYKFEDKIGHLGGWEKFLASKVPAAEKDPLQDDHHAIGVSIPQRRTSFLDEERANQHDVTFKEARELAGEHKDTGVLSNRIMRGLLSTKILDVKSALGKAKTIIAEKELIDANPLHFLHEEAQSLGRDLIDKAFHLPMEERTESMELYVELTKSWMDEELLKLWILEAKEKLTPSKETNTVLPPVTVVAGNKEVSTTFAHEYQPGKDDRSKTEKIDRTQGGGRRRKPTGEKKGNKNK